MSETESSPSARRWADFRIEMITAREARRKAMIGARLKLLEDVVTARFAFRRAVVRGVSELVAGTLSKVGA